MMNENHLMMYLNVGDVDAPPPPKKRNEQKHAKMEKL